MKPMWIKRYLYLTVSAIVLGFVAAAINVHGYAFFVFEAVAVPLVMLGSIAFTPRAQRRQRGQLR